MCKVESDQSADVRRRNSYGAPAASRTSSSKSSPSACTVSVALGYCAYWKQSYVADSPQRSASSVLTPGSPRASASVRLVVSPLQRRTSRRSTGNERSTRRVEHDRRAEDVERTRKMVKVSIVAVRRRRSPRRPVEDTLYARYTAFENTPALSTEGAFTSFL